MGNPWCAVAPTIAAVALRLILLAAALQLGGVGALIQLDTGSYFRPGINLLLHGQFASGGLPELVRTPGYPLFLALLSCAGPLPVVLAQILLSAVSVILVWRIARMLYADERVALAAACPPSSSPSCSVSPFISFCSPAALKAKPASACRTCPSFASWPPPDWSILPRPRPPYTS